MPKIRITSTLPKANLGLETLEETTTTTTQSPFIFGPVATPNVPRLDVTPERGRIDPWMSTNVDITGRAQQAPRNPLEKRNTSKRPMPPLLSAINPEPSFGRSKAPAVSNNNVRPPLLGAMNQDSGDPTDPSSKNFDAMKWTEKIMFQQPPKQKVKFVDSKFYKGLGKFSKAMDTGLAVASPIVQYFSDRAAQRRFDNWLRQRSLTGNLYSARPASMTGNRGDYDINTGVFRSDELTPPNKGMYTNSFSYGTNIVKEGGTINNDIMQKVKIRITGGDAPEKMATGGQPMTYSGQLGYGINLGQKRIYTDMPPEKTETINKTLKPVPREQANIEAEKGETVFGDIDGDGAMEHMLIGGKKHTEGGTPLNVPEGSFIFSDTKELIIKDPKVLEKFNMPSSKKGYTPAEIAKKYDTTKYKAVIEDPNSDPIKKTTAQIMVKTFEKKLAELALIQEQMKGFPQGIPEVAKKYFPELQTKEDQEREPGASENIQFGQQQAPEEEMSEDQLSMQAMQDESIEQPQMEYGGMIPKFEPGGQNPNPIATILEILKNPNYRLPEPEPVQQNNLSPWPGDKYQNKANASKYTKDQWAEKLRKLGYTGPLNNLAVQKWLYTQPRSKEVIDRLHTKYGRPLKGSPSEGKFDEILGYRWDEALDSLDVNIDSVIGYVCLGRDEATGKANIEEQSFKDVAARSAAGAAASRNEALAQCPEKPIVPGTMGGDGSQCPPGYQKDVNGKCVKAPFGYMTPDLTNMLAAAWVAPKKYLPWGQKLPFEPGDVVFKDWRAKAAERQSMMNRMADQLATYSPGTATAANLSFLAGQQGEGVIRDIDETAAYNVQTANAFADRERQRKDQNNLYNLAKAEEIYKGNVIANQQYDNAKRQYINNLAKTYAQAWKNRMNLGLLNAVNPMFNIDPYSGRSWFKGGYGENDFAETTGASSGNFRDRVTQLMSEGYSKDLAEKRADAEARGAMSGGRRSSRQTAMANARGLLPLYASLGAGFNPDEEVSDNTLGLS